MIKVIKEHENIDFTRGAKDVAVHSKQIICTSYNKNCWVEEHNDGLIAFFYKNQTFWYSHLRKYLSGESEFVAWLREQGFVK